MRQGEEFIKANASLKLFAVLVIRYIVVFNVACYRNVQKKNLEDLMIKVYNKPTNFNI